MTDTELLATKIRERLTDELLTTLRPHYDKVCDGLTRLGLETFAAETFRPAYTKRVEELTKHYLPHAMEETLAKVTFNVLTEGRDGQTEKTST